MPITISGSGGISGIVSVTASSENITVFDSTGGAGTVYVGTGASITSPATNVLTLGTNNTEDLRIDAAGNIGVGTTAPASTVRLDVVGGIKGTIVQGTSQVSTAGTSIDFTGIPSWVKRVTVMFNGVSTSGTSNPQIQLGAGSVTTSGYNSTSTSAGAAVATTNATSGFLLYLANAGATTSGHAVLTLVSGNTWICSNIFKNTTAVTCFGAGDITLSGTLDRVRITTVNGTDTFDAGSINILYEG
jgi:hypothetical protein